MGNAAAAALNHPHQYTKEEKERLARFAAGLEGYGEKEKIRLMELCLTVALSPDSSIRDSPLLHSKCAEEVEPTISGKDDDDHSDNKSPIQINQAINITL